MGRNTNPYRKAGVVLTLFLGFCIVPFWAGAQTPTISSVSRQVGATGEIVSIAGDGFGTNAANLQVSFGAVRGTILRVDNQLIDVKVPAGATYDEIAVTNTVSKRTAYSRNQFMLSYGSNGIPFNLANDFQRSGPFTTEDNLTDLCLCDLDAGTNGKSEILSTNSKINFTGRLNNNSTPGTFSFIKIPASVVSGSGQIKCGDINGDARPDVILSEFEDSRVYIYLNGGSSHTLTLPSIPGSDQRAQAKRIEISDIDLDGLSDIIVSNNGQDNVTVFHQNVSTTGLSFSPVPVNTGFQTDGLAVVDLNNDGYSEIVTSRYQNSTNQILVFPNKSTPGTVRFDNVISLGAISTVIDIKVGDLNGDNKPEIIATEFVPNNNIFVFENRSGGSISFASPIKILVDARPWDLDLGDLDGDGRLDIAVGHNEARSIAILINKGNLGFDKYSYDAGHTVQHLKIGDIDGDGKPDIAYANRHGRDIYILRNKRCVKPRIFPEGPHSVCVGAPLQLSTTENPGSTYEWSKDSGIISTATGPQYTVPTSTDGPAANFTLKITGTDGCVETSAPVQVTVSNGTLGGSPNATYNNNAGPVCVGSPLELQINDVGADEYRWSGPDNYSYVGTTSLNRSPTINNFQAHQAGRYIVELVAGSCVAGRDTVLVQAVLTPSFTINTGGSDVFCEGGTKTLSVAPTPSGYTFQWYETSAGEISGQTSSNYTATASGEYYVQAKYTGCLETESQRASIREVDLPQADFEMPSTACRGSVVEFTNRSTSQAGEDVFYLWDLGDGNTSADGNVSHIYNSARSYTVTLTVSYEGNMCSNTATKTLSVQNAPAVSVINPQNKYAFCPGDSLRLEVSPATFNSYTWSTSATSSFIIVKEAGTYTVEVTTAGCTLQASKDVTVFENPVVTVVANPPLVDEGQSSQLSASGLEVFEWIPVETLTDATTANPIATPLETTQYVVQGTDANGCSGEGSVTVEVKADFIVNKLIPRAFFSPNGDSESPHWTVPEIEEYPVCGVSVYDEKGVKVFEAKPYQNDWDGTFNGKQLPDGVYYYIIRCDGEEGKPKSGSITLLR